MEMWMALLYVLIGGGLALLGNYLMIVAKHRRWRCEQQARVAEEIFKIYNELYSYFSFLFLSDNKQYPQREFMQEIVSQTNVQKLLADSRRVTPIIPLYFNEDISILWLEILMMLEYAVEGRLVFDLAKALDKEEISKEMKEFYTKINKLYKLIKKELGIK